ncbi:MAG: hypothetical protein IKW28_06120 [Lachnospiraceae bacterium]|nr:hypothetical protein [Lachnospiraceae bacterium]
MTGLDGKAYREQGIDLKRLTLVLAGKLWIPVAALILGALLGAVSYRLITSYTNGNTEYRVSADYYITFNFDEFEHGDDYYNAYTWDGILKDDPIVDYAMTKLPKDITKEKVRQSVSGEMLGDYRILTVHITTESREMSELLADAYEASLVQFGQDIELLEKIERWSREEAAILEKNTKTANAAFLGAVLAGLCAMLSLLYYYILEYAFYTEKDIREGLAIPVFGMKTKKQDSREEERLCNNLKVIGEEYVTWEADKIPDCKDWESLGKKKVVLFVPWGKNIGRKTERLLEEMSLHACQPAGAVLVEAEDRFIHAYYGGRK